MMSVKILLKILLFSIWLQGFAFGLTQNNDTGKLLKLEKQVQIQADLIKNLQKQNRDMEQRMDRLHPPATCSALLKEHPSKKTGSYYIYPKGRGSSRVLVHCDMTSKNGVGVTEIGHDEEHARYISGYESPGSYKKHVYYDISIGHIIDIMRHSQNCEQFIQYQCHHSFLFHGNNGWWISRQGWRMNYWGGAAVGSGKCACGMTNSCAGGGKCHCDKNDRVWRQDSGYLTDKNTLPVTELAFGDTGESFESGYHTLGKLRCWG